MAGIYNFIRGIPGKLGVGVADEGLLRSSTLPNYSGIGVDRMVRRSLAPLSGSFAQLVQDVPTASPLGSTGSTLHGVVLLGQLAKKNGG